MSLGFLFRSLVFAELFWFFDNMHSVWINIKIKSNMTIRFIH